MSAFFQRIDLLLSEQNPHDNLGFREGLLYLDEALDHFWPGWFSELLFAFSRFL